MVYSSRSGMEWPYTSPSRSAAPADDPPLAPPFPLPFPPPPPPALPPTELFSSWSLPGAADPVGDEWPLSSAFFPPPPLLLLFLLK